MSIRVCEVEANSEGHCAVCQYKGTCTESGDHPRDAWCEVWERTHDRIHGGYADREREFCRDCPGMCNECPLDDNCPYDTGYNIEEENGMNIYEAIQAAQGGRIYRKATWTVVRFQSGMYAKKNNLNAFPTLEDMTATDWYPVRPGSVRDRVTLI